MARNIDNENRSPTISPCWSGTRLLARTYTIAPLGRGFLARS